MTALMLASAGVLAAMAVFAFLTASHLPADAVLPIHWDASRTPDRFADALSALLLPVVLGAAATLIFSIIPRLEPLQDSLRGSAPLLRASWGGLMLLFATIQITMGLPAYGIAVPVNAILLAVGIFLIVFGNALPKSRPGFFVGIRTPWAIIDEDNWIATHRFGGKLMMAAGLVIVIASIAPIQPETTAIIVLAAVFAGSLIPVGYSWWLWQNGKGLTE